VERFQKLLEALFFCSALTDNRSPLKRGGFLVSATPLSGKPPGVGYWWRRAGA